MSRKPNTVKCLIDGCDVIAKSKGHCPKHYNKAKYSGAFSNSECETEGCKRAAVWTNVCRSCYDKKRYSSLERKERKKKCTEICIIADCNKAMFAKKLCQMHYARLLRNGEIKPRQKKRTLNNFKVNFSNGFQDDFSYCEDILKEIDLQVGVLCE